MPAGEQSPAFRNIYRDCELIMTTATDDVTEEVLNGENCPKFDVAEHLDSPEVIAAYLSEAFTEGDSALIAEALRDAARAEGMSEIANRTGLARESLYKALRQGSQPRLDTILRVLKALGFELVVKPVPNVGSSDLCDD